jgi:hypothetical protein
MQRKHSSADFTAVSVSLDDANDKPVRKKVDTFLQKQGADFPNFIREGPAEAWLEKLDAIGPPVVYVFDRDNHFVLKEPRDKGGEVDYEAVSKAVEALMKK